MDQLRYWVIEMSCRWVPVRSGSRRSRASSRESTSCRRSSTSIHQDPILSQVKLIAEPWDVGRAGIRWATSRCCGRNGTGGIATACASSGRRRRTSASSRSRLTGGAISTGSTDGSAARDQLHHGHDGFTLRDLVSLQRQAQRRQWRGERDGTNDNRLELRSRGADRRSGDRRAAARQQRNFWRRCSSRRECPCCWPGTSSVARRGGNNNAYCQDNEFLVRLGCERS